MPEQDLHSRIKAEVSMSPQTISGAGTLNGAAHDTKGFESIEYVIQTGTVTAVSATSDLFTIEQAPDDGTGSPGSWAAVPAAEQLGATIATLLATDDDTEFRIGSVGKERHQRLVLVRTGASANYLMSAVAILGHPRNAPVSDQST